MRRAATKWSPGLGPINLALISVYFIPTWGRDALRVLVSPWSGFEDRAHAAAAVYVRQLFDLGLDGMMRVSNALAALKLVIAAGFLAYLIEFARGLAVGREPNRETADVVLALAVGAVLVWALPAFTLDDPTFVRVYATQILMLAGAVVLFTVERHIEASAEAPAARPAVIPAERVFARGSSIGRQAA